MIIDSHIHFGKILNFDMKKEHIIEAMDKYNIEFAIVSNIEATEFGHKLDRLPDEYQVEQVAANQRTVDFIKQYPDKLRGLFWIKPHLEGYSRQIEKFFMENKEYIKGVKVHPYHSKLPFTVENYKDYLDMAVRLNLPVIVHTAVDELSDPKNVYEVAKKYPNINFVLVHMGLGGDHLSSIEHIKELPNLYGDTTWVDPASALKAVRECGSDKIMFGTDAPIDGVDTYEKYEELIEYLSETLTEEEFANVFYNTAKELFKL
jgi:predicted TIM-barrel fold metal-dependent hydrolase